MNVEWWNLRRGNYKEILKLAQEEMAINIKSEKSLGKRMEKNSKARKSGREEKKPSEANNKRPLREILTRFQLSESRVKSLKKKKSTRGEGPE